MKRSMLGLTLQCIGLANVGIGLARMALTSRHWDNHIMVHIGQVAGSSSIRTYSNEHLDNGMHVYIFLKLAETNGFSSQQI